MQSDDSVRARRRRALRSAAAGAALVILAGTGVACAGSAACPRQRCGHRGFSSDATRVQLVTAKVGGKVVFIPSTIVVTSGVPYTLSIFNTTEIPHGFRIAGLGIEDVLPPQEEHVVELPPLEGQQVLQINCQLHPAHRTATLVVLPAR